MKLTVIMALVAGMAWAGGTGLGRTLTVCPRRNADILTFYRAQSVASRMFATAGVKIDWRDPRSCPAGAILVSLAEVAPASDHPGAMAYAMPYEGTHIVVFYDRIRIRSAGVAPNALPVLLAHVLVHEIAHILQGVDRHSETGVMKACWENLDFSQMRFKPLPFTALDVDLIQRGLDGRNRNAAPVVDRLSTAAAQ
jgi:hypothetical protein